MDGSIDAFIHFVVLTCFLSNHHARRKRNMEENWGGWDTHSSATLCVSLSAHKLKQKKRI